MAIMGPKRQRYGTRVYPPILAEMAKLGMDEIGVYIARRQNTVTQYIVNRPIMDLCLAAEQEPGLQLSRRCWEQPALDILGIREGNAVAEVGG